MDRPDVLIVTALEMEYEAMVGAIEPMGFTPVADAPLEEKDSGTDAPYSRGDYTLDDDARIRLALSYADRMSGTPVLMLATTLVAKLKPRCLAMCGVCAGNPADVALGDVIVAELTYQYDEGKREADRFLGDHRQSPLTDATWLRRFQKLKAKGLPSYGVPTEEDAKLWFLERVGAQRNAKDHPARKRYIPDDSWELEVHRLEEDGFIEQVGTDFKLTRKGRARVNRSLAYGTPPKKLPFAIKVGPIASGNAVVKDEVTWESLKTQGVRTVLGLEMEAAAIGYLGRTKKLDWIVAKGVMDHADPKKDDRYKSFAAKASAETLFRFLISEYAKPPAVITSRKPGRVKPPDDGVSARAWVALMETIFDGDHYLPGGGLKDIRLPNASQLISDDLSSKIHLKVRYDATLKQLADTFVELGLIRQALSELVDRISQDWASQIAPYTKLSILQLSEQFPGTELKRLGKLKPLTKAEQEIASINWGVADALFEEERGKYVKEMAEQGLDLENKTVSWNSPKETFEGYVAAFKKLITYRIAIDLALVTASTKQSKRQATGYIVDRARRTTHQITTITDAISMAHHDKAKAYRLLSGAMKESVEHLITHPLDVTPSLEQMKLVRNSL